MSALAKLQEQGLRVRISGEQLIVAPRAVLTDELRALIRAQRRNILNELAGQDETQRAVRRAKVEAELRTKPEMRLAFDVLNVPPDRDADEPVSVVLAVRHGEHILSGELCIPPRRWNMALFLRMVDPGSERPS